MPRATLGRPVLPMSDTPLFQHPATHWCFVQGSCIVLDVTQNRYLSIPAHKMKVMLPYLQSVETDAGSRALPIPADLLPIANELVTSGVLTTQRPNSQRRPSSPLPRPTRLLPQFPSSTTRGFLKPLLLPFLKSCALADYQLRYRSLSAVVSRIVSRQTSSPVCPPELTAERTAHLASAFTALRPFYPRRYWCMFDSLALIEFLFCWKLLPHWVFGVSADPFFAHCWVQDGDLVLCDTRDFSATRFSPIMTL